MMIDFHTHIYPDMLAKRTLDALSQKCGLEPATDGTLRGTAEFYEQCKIDKFVVQNIATNEKQVQNVNNFAIAMAKEYPQVVAFGSVYPCGDSYKQQIAQLSAAGIKGIKLHPEYQNFKVSDKCCYDVVELALKNNLIVLFHAGHDVAYLDTYNASPRELKKLDTYFASDKIVFAHLGGFGAYDEVMEYLLGSHAYFDTACIASSFKMSEAREIILGHGTDKILFGSDCPWESPQKTCEFLAGMQLNNEDMQRILCLNAKKLLGL